MARGSARAAARCNAKPCVRTVCGSKSQRAAMHLHGLCSCHFRNVSIARASARRLERGWSGQRT
eukprot:4520110-Lingulodinium_polyedra.AAC.1